MAAMVEKLIIAFVIISCYILNAASLSKYVFVHKRMQPTLVTSNVPILARYANLGMITKQSRSYQQYQTLSPRRTYFHRYLTELRISSQSISNASNNLLQLLYSSLLKWNSYSARLFSILISLVEPTIAGGLLSGGLHAITGPDHMAALLPPSIGRSGWYGSRLGAVWGIGHGISSITLGMAAFALKGRVNSKFIMLEKVSNLADLVVGASLIAIGVIGIKESSETEITSSLDTGLTEGTASVSGSGVVDSSNLPTVGSSSLVSVKNTFANGVLHGFSLDGAPSLLPALAMSTWKSAFTFLFAYSIGTMVAMSAATGIIADFSMRLGKMVNDPTLPKRLSFVSSLVAIAIGVFWIVKAVFFR